MKHIAFLVVSAVVALVVAGNAENIIPYLLSALPVGWVTALFVPTIVTISCSLLFGLSLWNLLRLSKVLRVAVTAVSSVALIVVGVAMAPIYIEDLERVGEPIGPNTFPNNSIVSFLNKNYPTFDGLFCIASVGCPHCERATVKLSQLQSRNPELDIVVFVFTNKPEKLAAFQDTTQVDNLTFHMVPDQDGTLQLNFGAFPTFYYHRNQQIVHKWESRQFGFAAFDWVEGRLEQRK